MPGRWSAAVIAAGLALIVAIGLLVEGLQLFPALTFAVQRSPEHLPSTTIVPRQEVAAGTPLLSLAVREEDLRDPERGLLTHPMARGPEWERPAFVSYFDRGRLRFGAPVGIRIHGGKSRQHSPVQSFRLYFERQYGADRVPHGIFFDGKSDPLRQVVVHNDLREDHYGRWWHLVNPLAYDIAARLGAITPRTLPARVFLNGEAQGAYVLTEHVTTNGFLRAHFGHANFTAADTRTTADLRRWVRNERPLTMARAGTVVDVPNLTSWFLSMLFCATTDAFQGVLLRDDTSRSARWFWVVWDMDHSFMDLYARAPGPSEHDTFRELLRRPELRSELVTRLLAEDPAYRAYFKQALAAALNHQLTPDFLAERFEHYARSARALRVADTEYLGILDDFLRQRPSALLRLAERYLDDGRSFRCELRGWQHTSYRVDGFPSEERYAGVCFAGTTFRVESPADRPAPLWMVNGQPHGTPSHVLDVPIAGDVRVEPVYR